MGNPRGGAQHHRGIELLRKLQANAGHFVGFLRVRRVKQGHLGKFGIVATVLFVLRRMHARIIGDHQHQTGVDAGVGQSQQGIGGDIDADMLHGGQGTTAGNGSTNSRFEGDFFVGGPFAVHFVKARNFF